MYICNVHNVMDIILSLRKSLVLSICFFRGYPYEGEYKSIITLSDYLSQIVILLRSSAFPLRRGGENVLDDECRVIDST